MPVAHLCRLALSRHSAAVLFDYLIVATPALRALRNIWRNRADHSALMFALRITLPHFSVSSPMNLPKPTGAIGIGTPPKSAIRAFSLGSASPALISLPEAVIPDPLRRSIHSPAPLNSCRLLRNDDAATGKAAKR